MNITDISKIHYVPYCRDKLSVRGLFWHILTFDQKLNIGSYILKYEVGAVTPEHTHGGREEFLILEGELFDSNGEIYKKNMFVSFYPGTKHYTYSKTGCTVLVFSGGANIVSKL